MDILAYSPKVEAYVATNRGGDMAYYDLTRDITSCNVTRKLDAASSFTLNIQNKGGKYNGLFQPMDRVTIYATGADGKRYQQITGYIKSAPSFRLFNADMTIQGRCAIYRLQELFWDPALIASQEVLGISDIKSNWDQVITNLLVKVAGYGDGQIRIAQIPQSVIDMAYQLYSAQTEDIADAKDMVKEFYTMLSTSGPTVGAAGMDAEGGTGNVASGTLGKGQTIEIPASLSQTGIIGDCTYYLDFEGRWAYKQGEVFAKWNAAGRKFDHCIATINGRYLFACVSRFGDAGDMVDITLEDGTVINGIIGDIKSYGDANSGAWGHNFGGATSLVEWEASNSFGQRGGKSSNSADLPPNWAGKKVKSMTNCGSIL